MNKYTIQANQQQKDKYKGVLQVSIIVLLLLLVCLSLAILIILLRDCNLNNESCIT